MEMTSTFFTMIFASVSTVAVQILRGCVNRILGRRLQIHVSEFLQHGETNEEITGMKPQMCQKGNELRRNNGLNCPETVCGVDEFFVLAMGE
jgi:hypothetical protein